MRVKTNESIQMSGKGAAGEKLTAGSPSTLAQLFSGAPQQGSFWDKPGGKILGTLLSTTALGGIGALLGKLMSPSGYGGLGAARGAAQGAAYGLQQDIGQRQAAAQAPYWEALMGAKKKTTPEVDDYLVSLGKKSVDELTPEERAGLIPYLKERAQAMKVSVGAMPFQGGQPYTNPQTGETLVPVTDKRTGQTRWESQSGLGGITKIGSPAKPDLMKDPVGYFRSLSGGAEPTADTPLAGGASAPSGTMMSTPSGIKYKVVK